MKSSGAKQLNPHLLPKGHGDRAAVFEQLGICVNGQDLSVSLWQDDLAFWQ